MSDSVDRWHPSNMSKLALVGASELTLDRENGRFTYFSDYEALFADRGRVLAAARELAEAVGSDLMYVEGATVSDRTLAALASFREVDQ